MKIFRPFRLLVAVVVILFLIWQLWVFLTPSPRPLRALEIRATEAVAANVTAELGRQVEGRTTRTGVIRFSGDSSGEITEVMRRTIRNDGRFSIEERSVPVSVVSDIGSALMDASTLQELASAGREVGIDLIVLGRVVELASDDERANIRIDIGGYDTREGRWIVRDSFAGAYSPGFLERRTERLRGTPLWQRAVIWILVVAALPWLTPFATRKAANLKSNFASFMLVVSYGSFALFLGGFLLGFTLEGFLAWIGFLLAAGFAFAYSWWACETIASGG